MTNKKPIITKKIDYLVVPCPGNPTLREDRVVFKVCEELKEDKNIKLYLGAENRMRAAVLKSKNAKNIILVGGSQSKVVAMYIYFEKKMCAFSKKEKKPILISLVSRPDSTGNLSACKKYFEREGINIQKTKKKILIISNEYHLERLGLISKDVFGRKLMSISAEKVLNCDKEVRKQYEKALVWREFFEREGRKDWQNRLYRNQEKIINWDSKFWKCEELILNFELKIL